MLLKQQGRTCGNSKYAVPYRSMASGLLLPVRLQVEISLAERLISLVGTQDKPVSGVLLLSTSGTVRAYRVLLPLAAGVTFSNIIFQHSCPTFLGGVTAPRFQVPQTSLSLSNKYGAFGRRAALATGAFILLGQFI